MRSSLTSIALAGALLTATGLSAQSHPSSSADRGPTGLVLGANLTGAFATVDGATFGEHTFQGRGREGGGGMHLTVGYAFPRGIAVLVHGGGMVLNEEEERTLGGMELALRYGIVSGPRWLVPYLEMGVGGYALEDRSDGGDAEFTGGSVSVAAGFNFFVTRQVAINADFRSNMGMFSTVARGSRRITDDARMGFGSSRVNVGFNWYPFAR